MSCANKKSASHLAGPAPPSRPAVRCPNRPAHGVSGLWIRQVFAAMREGNGLGFCGVHAVDSSLWEPQARGQPLPPPPASSTTKPSMLFVDMKSPLMSAPGHAMILSCFPSQLESVLVKTYSAFACK